MSYMEFILLAVILLQFGYIVYKDILFSNEREKLQLKLMSKDVAEYVSAVEKPEEPKKTEREPDVYFPVEDMPVDRIIKAKEKL